MPLKHACFLSYRHGTQPKLKRINDEVYTALCSELEPLIKCDVPVFKDTMRLRAGDYLDETMARALCESACLIVVYVPIYLDLAHTYCAREFRAMEQLEKKRYEALTEVADKARSLIITIAFCDKTHLPAEIIGDRSRLFVDFQDFGTDTRSMLKNRKYISKIKEIAEYIYERFTLLNKLSPDPCGNCAEFELPRADSDEVQKLLEDTIQPFPR